MYLDSQSVASIKRVSVMIQNTYLIQRLSKHDVSLSAVPITFIKRVYEPIRVDRKQYIVRAAASCQRVKQPTLCKEIALCVND